MYNEAKQPANQILSAQCHILCHFHCQIQWTKQSPGINFTYRKAKEFIKSSKGNQGELNFLQNQHKHSTVGLLVVTNDSNGHASQLWSVQTQHGWQKKSGDGDKDFEIMTYFIGLHGKGGLSLSTFISISRHPKVAQTKLLTQSLAASLSSISVLLCHYMNGRRESLTVTVAVLWQLHSV